MTSMFCDYCMTQLHLETRPVATAGNRTVYVDQLGSQHCTTANANHFAVSLEEVF